MRNVITSPIDAASETTTGTTVSRRRLLRGVGASVALLGVGGASSATAQQEDGRFNDAPGRGGQAVVPASDFTDDTFVITERTGDSAETIDGVLYSCSPEQSTEQQIFLVGWHFTYVDDDEVRTLYTRSNNVETGKEYDWNVVRECADSGQEIPAGGFPQEPVDMVQAAYRATGDQ
ncbi:hypothetical protein OB919_20500 [Halobacteria archaeon AArc-curdl1]|uniref:Uncharacterized protein n=1 Tax=Natronosalvus hydrolyticus TaxID=2979988 RepID=A0AAP2ZCA4_9EURY|nr:hypothetical protein [Halobacteria archaeon AArc-curdl1]